MLDYDSFDFFENLLAASLVAVPLFFLLPWARARRILLGTLGAYLLFLVAPRLLAFYLPFWAVVFALQYLVAAVHPPRWRTVALWFAILCTLAPMVLWKLFPTPFIIHFNLFFDARVDDLSPWLGAVDRVRDIILPVGLSFAAFRAVDLLVKVYLEISAPLSPTRLWAVGFFPPVQVIGPVIEHTEIERDLDVPRRAGADDAFAGIVQVSVGLVKVFVISYALKPSNDVFTASDVTAWWKVWVELFAFALYFYFNFSGFSDVAIGSARLYGFRLKPNFDNPYMKTNPQAFWNSWHMSLTRWAQRNVFVPLGGMRPQHQYRAIFATIMVIALWHDLSLALVAFGLYHAAGLIGHRMLVSHRRPRADPPVWLRVAKMGLLFVFVTFSFPMLVMRSSDLVHFYGRLFGVG